ncbi:MAG: hypothetical protein AAB339_04220, partial [Elusimicrobiota bacterium]
QSGFSRLKNIDFYYLFAADNSQANYGLQSSHPYLAVLNDVNALAQGQKFTRWTVSLNFKRRDTSDSNGNGLTSDLVNFVDSNSNLADDYDSNIKYFDQNTDGDYYETYTSGSRTVAEEPDTHIKEVTLKVYRRDRLACSQTELISLEQFSGDSNPSSEAALTLDISTPSNSAYLYRKNTTALNNAWSLAISKSYPSDVAQLRADAASPLQVSGVTDPLATVNEYLNGSALLDTTVSDVDGDFNHNPAAITAMLVEGQNQLTAQAVKSPYTSPIAPKDLILDINPPALSDIQPSAGSTVNSFSPFVGATLEDAGISTTSTSGICEEVMTLKIGGSSVSYRYDSGTGRIYWIDFLTQTVPVLSAGAYTALLEAGDYAGYKTTQSWTFTVQAAPGGTDNSAPSTANKTPLGASAPALPVISVRVFDNQTGIIPSSLLLRVDGSTVANSENIGSHYDPYDGTLSWTPAEEYASGSSHTVEVTASHWGTDPLDKVTTVESWNFTVE